MKYDSLARMTTPLDPVVSVRLVPPPPPPLALELVQRTLLSRLSCAALSSCGSVHGVNEDACSPLLGSWRLFVVADGVGGGAMAALASRELVSRLHAALDGAPVSAVAVQQAMLAADRTIASRIAEVTQSPGAATVALCAPVNATASTWLVAWVGDCRVYRIDAAGSVQQLTRDDTFGHLNETPPVGGSNDDPARMVGNGAVSQPNVMLVHVRAGDMLLACTDGIHKHVAPADLAGPRGSPAQRCAALLARARANGSTDDATVLIVQRLGVGLPGLRRLGRWFASRRTRS